MRALILLALVAPLASAATAFPDGAAMGEREASVPLRARGEVVVASDAPVEAALAAPGERPGAFADAPARLAGGSGAWRGLEGIQVLWLRREGPTAVTVEVVDEDGTGFEWVWPARQETPGAGVGVGLAFVGLAAFLAARR